MTKPVIVNRATKASPLTLDEQDANFTNLQDATITLTAGTGGTAVVSDLNGVITLVAGTNITLSGDNTAKTITINSAASGTSSLPVNGTYYPVVNQGSGDSVFIRDNTNNLSAKSLISLEDGAGANTDPSKLESISYWQMQSKNAALNYNFYLSADVKTLTAFEGGGVRLPRVTTTERNAVNYTGGLKGGLIVFNTTTGNFEGYNGSTWVTLG
jgi:hypothetical protein